MLELDAAYEFNRFCHSPLLSVTQVLTDIGTCTTKKETEIWEKKGKSEQQTQILYKVVFLNEYGRLVILKCIQNKQWFYSKNGGWQRCWSTFLGLFKLYHLFK